MPRGFWINSSENACACTKNIVRPVFLKSFLKICHTDMINLNNHSVINYTKKFNISGL